MQSAILLLISLAFASAYNFETSFVKPKTSSAKDGLVYDYESDVLHGIEGVSKTYSGLKIKGQLEIHSSLNVRSMTGTTFCKLRNVEIYQAKSLELPTPLNRIPVGDMARLSDVEDLIQMIEKPFAFKFNQAEIVDGKILVDEDEETWSVNIKRSICSTMQTVLPRPLEKTPRVTSKMERDIMGTCESKVMINNLETESSIVVIDKVRNFTNCQDESSPIYKFSTSALARCLERTEDKLSCKYEIIPFQKIEHRYHKLSESSNVKLIPVEMKQTNMHFIPVTGVKVNTVTVHGICSLTLKKVVPEFEGERDIPSNFVKRDIEFEVNEKQLLVEKMNKYNKMSEAEQERLVEEIATEVKILHEQIKLGNEETKVQLEKVVGLLRKCTPRMVQQVLKQVRDEERQQMLVDLLPTCATPECIEVVLNKITKEESVSLVKSISYIQTIALKAQPTKEVVEMLFRISENIEKVSLKRAVVLAVGTMTERLQTLYKDARKYREIESFVERITSKLIDIAKRNIKSNMDRCKCVLKALGNIQLTQEQVRKTLELAQSKEYEPEMRIEAIDTVRKVISFEHLEKVLLEIFLDQTEDVELRMHCVKMLVEKQCSLPVLQLIVQKIPLEQNLNLKSFVCSMLKSFSEMTYPTVSGNIFRDNLKNLLITNKLPVFQPQYSHTLKMYGLDLPSLNGAYSILQYTNPIQSQVVPSWINYRAFITTGEHFIQPVEVNLKTKGLPQYVQQLLGSKIDLIAKLFEGEWTVDQIREILQEESMKLPRELKELFQNKEYREIYMSRDFLLEKNLELSIRLFNYEMIYLDLPAIREIAEDVLKTLVVKSSSPRDMLSQVTDLLEQLESGLEVKMTNILGSVNAMTLVPSPVGLPTMQNNTMVNIFHLRGKLQIVTEPSLKSCLRHLRFPEKIQIKTQEKDLQIRNIWIVRQKLITALPKVQTGVMYEAFLSSILPINGELELVRKDVRGEPVMNLRASYKLAQRQKPALTAYIRPAFILVQEEKKELKVYEQVTPILSKQTVEPFTVQKTLEIPYIFPRITMELESCVRKTPFSAIVPLACPNKLRLVVEEEMTTPVELVVELRPYERVERPLISESWASETAYQKLWTALYEDDEFQDTLNDTESRIPFEFGHVDKHVYRTALKVRLMQASSGRWLRAATPEVELKLKWLFTRNFLQHQFALLMTQKSLPKTFIKGHFAAPALCFNGFCNRRQFSGISVFVENRRVSMLNLYVEDLQEINKYLGIQNEQCFNQQTRLLKYVLPQTIKAQMINSPVAIKYLSKEVVEVLVICQNWITETIEKFADVSMRYNPRVGVFDYELLVKMCPAMGKIDLVANTLMTTIRATNIPVFSFLAPEALPVRSTATRPSLYRPVCTKTAKIVRTFEGKIYHTLENNECETVLAKDCRPRPQWMITSTTLENAQQEIHIYHGEEKSVKIIPQGYGILPKIQVDKKTFDIEMGLNTIRIPLRYNREDIVCHREGFEREQQVVCQSETQGWKLITDGYETKVVIVPEMRGYVCGQCEYLRDTERSDKLVSHVIESRETRRQCRRESFVPQTCEPVLQHRIVKQQMKKGEMICISQQAFPQCQKACRGFSPIKYKTLRDVKFVCMKQEEAISRGYLPASYYKTVESIESIDRVFTLPWTEDEITLPLYDVHQRCD